MLIAFEGPDQVGKSTSATELAWSAGSIYNATKANHKQAQEDQLIFPDAVLTFDRIDWFSHMVYRLALPDREWNDARPRTVFAMPDTHLVVKIHKPELADFTAPEEIVDTPIANVNQLYYYFADFFLKLNANQGFSLFKTVSIVEVSNDTEAGTFTQLLQAFSSPVLGQPGHVINSDAKLLEFLKDEEAQRA